MSNLLRAVFGDGPGLCRCNADHISSHPSMHTTPPSTCPAQPKPSQPESQPPTHSHHPPSRLLTRHCAVSSRRVPFVVFAVCALDRSICLELPHCQPLNSRAMLSPKRCFKKLNAANKPVRNCNQLNPSETGIEWGPCGLDCNERVPPIDPSVTGIDRACLNCLALALLLIIIGYDSCASAPTKLTSPKPCNQRNGLHPRGS